MYKVIGADGQEYEASSLEELKEWVKGGSVGPETLITGPQGSGWLRASEYSELKCCFRRPSPPPAQGSLPVVHIGEQGTDRPLQVSLSHQSAAPGPAASASEDKASLLDIILAFVPLIGPIVGICGIYQIIRGRFNRGGTMLGCAIVGWCVLRFIVMKMTGQTDFWDI